MLELDKLQAVKLATPAVVTAPGVNTTFWLGGVVVYANSGTSPSCKAESPKVKAPHALAARLNPTEPVTELATPVGAVAAVALSDTPLPPRIELIEPEATLDSPPKTEAELPVALLASPNTSANGPESTLCWPATIPP